MMYFLCQYFIDAIRKASEILFVVSVDIYGLVMGEKIMINASGTSSAAPFITTLASFLLHVNPKLTPKDLKFIIKNNNIEVLSHEFSDNIKMVNFEKSLNYIL